MMRKKDMLNSIKSDIESHIPKDAPKMDYALISALRAEEDLGQESLPKRFRMPIFNLKMVMSVLLISIIAVGIWVLNTPKGISEVELPSGKDILEQEMNVLPLSFLSNASLLPSAKDRNINQNLSLNLNTNLADVSPMDDLKPFLSLVESILNGKTKPVVEVKVSTNPEYETYVVVQTSDLLGMGFSYELYYNVKSFDKKDDDTTFIIEGIMIKDGLNYTMYGKKEVESDEETITIRSYLDDFTYIETIYETDTEESEYTIKHVKNNQTIYESVLQIESDEEEFEIELEIYTASTKSVYKMSYELDEDEPVIEIEFEIEELITGNKKSGEMSIYIRIDDVTNMSHYEVFITTEDESYEETYDRDDHDDDDEDDLSI